MTYLKFTGFLLPVFSVLLSTAQSSQDIKLNQVGFFPKSIKKAFITGQVTKSEFYITTTNHKDTVYKGIIGNSKQSSFSSTITRSVDFSRFEKPGRYVIVIPSVGYSYPFLIDNT